MTSPVVITDGGRAAAGFRGSAGDCVVRALAIAMAIPYAEVYSAMADINTTSRRRRKLGRSQRSARDGVDTRCAAFRRYMESHGWRWVATMGIGSGCQVHLLADELPRGRIIAAVSRHYVAVVDGVVHDTHDSTRGGTRCVYGYWHRGRP